MNQNQQIQKQEGTTAVTVEKNISDKVANRVNELVKGGRIDLPANYSVGNAISSAWLILQGVKDKINQPVLKTCTQASIANALLDMAVMGLNPAKKQGYFIAYGNQLTWFTSYFGKCAVVKRLKGIAYEPVATIIYEGDEVELGHNELGEEYIVAHKTTWESKLKGIRVGAYATVKQNDIIRSAVMTEKEIKEAWMKNPGQNKRDHVDFEGEFMKRTVINRLVKMIAQTSNDDDLLAETMIVNEDKHYDFEGRAEAIAATEIKELANTGEVVDVEEEDETDTLGEVEQVVEFAEEPQPVKQQEPVKPTVARNRPF